MSITQPTETDYRAFLAFGWTIGTFAALFYMLLLGGKMESISAIMGLLLPLDAVFINAYFTSKQTKA
jgi:hypothetical protein